MTPEERAELREKHAVFGYASEEWCAECDVRWPCLTSRLLDELERVEAERDEAVRSRTFWQETAESGVRAVDAAWGERDALRAALAEALTFSRACSFDAVDGENEAYDRWSALVESVGLPEGKPQL